MNEKYQHNCNESQRVARVLTLHDSLQLRRDAIRHVHPSCSESPTGDRRRQSQRVARVSHTKRFFATGQLQTIALRRVGWCGLGLMMYVCVVN